MTDRSSKDRTKRLVERYRDGDESGFTELYARVAPAISAYAELRLGRGWIGPEDVVGEVFMRSRLRIDDYDPARSFRRWVFGIARHVVREAQRDIIRARATGTTPTGPDATAWAEDATTMATRIARHEDLRAFAAWASEALTEYEQDVLIHRGLRGLGFDDVAEALERSRRAVVVCWSTVLAKVKERAGRIEHLLAEGTLEASP